jgi:hypothetical protein
MYGAPKSFWGEWSCTETRRFYRQQLPVSLQSDGVLGLSLEERARIAAQARHALRLYARERCHLPGRLAATLFDGLRHLQTFGTWSGSGMTWPEVWSKYLTRAAAELGPDATEQQLQTRANELIVERACATNELADSGQTDGGQVASLYRLLDDLSLYRLSPHPAPTTAAAFRGGGIVDSRAQTQSGEYQGGSSRGVAMRRRRKLIQRVQLSSLLLLRTLPCEL